MTATTPQIGFETVIGLEVHAQVLTRSKMYCSCSAGYSSAEPNTHVCQVCMGLPGALPVINREAIELCVLTGIALDSEISGFSKLDRKNYVYPDLPKGYQISQYDLPLCAGGALSFESGGRMVNVGVTRVHIEEDTGRLLHRTSSDGVQLSLVDLNRSGVPLMEIVGEPDLRSPEHARDYLIAMRQLLRYIGASTGNMEEGAFRCDANVSTRSADGSLVGSKVEIKNMNSFRSVERALRFEEQRQRQILAAGGTIEQETRGWVEAKGITVSQRTKEQAHDYRYFPEPDLPPLTLTAEVVAGIASRLQELPAARRTRFTASFGLSESDAALMTAERSTADFFEQVIGDRSTPDRAKLAANWILNDLAGLQRERGGESSELPVTGPQLGQLLDMLESGQITARAAKELLPQLTEGDLPAAKARALNLMQLDDSAEIRAAALETVQAFPAAAADFQSGKTAAIGRLIGETIKRTGGRGRPEVVRQVLEELLRR
ncbi:Asp-tRNA(Asn)/Glu-tRNA(Gln) amidotransferase subunit GatB [soil metagenome]